MDSGEISDALVPASDHERIVRNGFWAKIRATAGRIPFVDKAVAAYYAALDPATPTHVKAVLLAALAYFVLPVDVIPDFIIALGYTDDATVLAAALRMLAPHITDAHRARAREALDKN